jgi:hypothetical protein
LPVISGESQEGHAATESEFHRHPDSGDAPVGAVRRRAKADRHRDLCISSQRADKHQE